MLAVSQDREGAALQGININRTAAIACIIACALGTLSGLVSLTSGEIWFNDKKINGIRPSDIVKLGLAHIPQADIFKTSDIVKAAYLGK